MRGWIDSHGPGRASPESAASAYDALAPAYDDLTHDYAHDRWVRALVDWGKTHGLKGGKALDVACGTGKSFLPLLALGYEVSGCDISTGMLAEAARKGTPATLHHADMRALPKLGSFDLITCLDDALNHLLKESEVVTALQGMFSNLTAGGLLMFDINTLRGFREAWSADEIIDMDGRLMLWRGRTDPDLAPGREASVQIDVFTKTRRGVGGWTRTTTHHKERHYPATDIEHMAAEAGLEIVDRRGQSPGVRLELGLNEARHTKGLFMLRRAPKAAAATDDEARR